MKRNFLEYYRQNLEHLRELSGEFAAQYPKIASRLNVSALEAHDPFVERLLEGTAFLAARVEKKFDDGYPLFLQSLLQRLCPSLTAPMPAATVLRIDNSGPTGGNLKLTTGFGFEVRAAGTTTPVIFAPLWDQELHALNVSDTQYLLPAGSGLSREILQDGRIKSCVGIDLNIIGVTDQQNAITDDVTLYLNMSGTDASRFTEALSQGLVRAFLKDGEETVELRDFSCEYRMDAADGNLLTRVLGTLPGITALQIFLTYPFFFQFVKFRGLGAALRRFGRTHATLMLCFNAPIAFTRAPDHDSVLSNCVPVINLFRKRSDRIAIDGRHEMLCDVSRTAPLDHEIFAVEDVEVFSRANRQQLTARPFYTASTALENEHQAVFFAMRRAERLNGLYRRRSNYVKTEIFMSFSGERYRSDDEELYEFTADCWVTNADLPLFVRQSADFASRDGRVRGRALLPLTKPRAPLVMRGDTEGFAGLAYVMLNVSSLLYQSGDTAVQLMRNLIGALYHGEDDERATLQSAVYQVESHSKVFRFVQRGSVFYEHGYETVITVDEKSLAGVGVYLFGSVLRKLLQDYSPVNLLVQVSLRGRDRGMIAQWPVNSD